MNSFLSTKENLLILVMSLFRKKFPLIRSFAILWIAHFFMDFFIGVWPIYKTLAGIDVLLAGIVIGIAGFTGELSQAFFGYFADRGFRKVILFVGVILSSAVLFVTAVQGFYSWLGLILLLMLGSGAFHPAANGMASSLVPGHQGKAILIFASGGAVGLGFSQLLFTKVLDRFHGHAYVLFFPLILVVLGILWHRFPKLQIAKKGTSIKEFFRPLMRNKRSLLLLYFAQIANQAVFVSFLFLLPDVLFTRGCQGWLCLGGGHMCVILGGAISMVVAGWLCDKYGHRIVLLSVFAGGLISLYLFLMQSSLSLSTNVLALSFLGAFLGVSNPVIISWGNRLVPESPSTVSALLMGFAWCFGNLAPIAAGLLVKQFIVKSYVIAAGIMGLGWVISTALIFFIPREMVALEENEEEITISSGMEDID